MKSNSAGCACNGVGYFVEVEGNTPVRYVACQSCGDCLIHGQFVGNACPKCVAIGARAYAARLSIA
jgi:DnaJ-class molecular chaperone